MKKTSKILSIILAMLMIISIIPITASAETPSSGTCGDNLTWTYDDTTYTLTISGTGDMYDFSDSDCPWDNYKNVIKNLVINDGVTTIGVYAFYNCSSLTSVTIPNSVRRISNYSFGYCSSLTSIEIPNSVTSIGLGSFKGCTSLQRMTIPFVGLTKNSNNGVDAVFGYIFGYTKKNTSGTVKQYYSSTDCYYFYIPSSLQSVTITNATQIPSYAFYGCSNLTCITIPDSVKIISEFAFYKCTSLTSVTIPDSVTTIGDKAFQYCTSLTSVTIPDSVTKFGIFAFANCDNLTSISIPNSVTKISNCAFSNCDSLTSISIPDNVTTIGDSAFSGCSNLESITIGENVTSIGLRAFSDCSNLTSIMFPDSVTAISAEIFDGCSKLESVIIGAGVTTIDENAFYACDPTSITVSNNNKYYSSDEYGVLFNKDKTTLIQYPTGNKRTNYIIPDSVTTIGAGAFYGCPNLESVTIGAGVTTIDSSAFGWCGLTSVRIPDSVTTIGERAFYSCYNLETATICNGVTTIGADAFQWCDSLTSVTIPDSVTTIGKYAFYHCSSLTDVYYGGTEAQWNKISILWNNEDLTSATIHYNYCEHKYNAVVTPPTCTEQGFTTYTCECGDTYVDDYVDALGHDIIIDEAVAPNCVNTGLTEGSHCSRCDDATTEQEVVLKTGHSHEAVITPPTCTEQGYTTYTCECGDTYVDDYVDALNHNKVNIVEENYVAPTCTENGSKDIVVHCSHCDEEISRETFVIKATGHEDNDGDGYCDMCNEQFSENSDFISVIINLIKTIINSIINLFGAN